MTMVDEDTAGPGGAAIPQAHVPNAEMTAAWDGEEGERWALDADHYESSAVEVWRAFLDAVPIAAGEDVLDIGCGNGASTRDVARLVAPGRVLGIDLSSQMLAVARERASAEGLGNVTFVQADAQVHPFGEAAFDLAISRFGAMFFDDPVAAFSNVARALRPGGRLAVLTWRPMADNQWMVALRDALALGRPIGTPPVSVPGPFGLADPDFTRKVLTDGAFQDINIAAFDARMNLGRDVDAAFAFVSRMGIVKGMTHDLGEADRQRALDAAKGLVAGALTEEGVILAGGAWLITARR